ncbi:hypothetical protein GQ600_23834 [Phytophthora cactorum]|nr:hypothetical protein GQ600_23834 [Phytophthora cactorum]
MVMQTAGGGRRSSDAGEAKGGEPTDETAGPELVFKVALSHIPCAIAFGMYVVRVGIGDGANARKEDMVKLRNLRNGVSRVKAMDRSNKAEQGKLLFNLPAHHEVITKVPPVPRLAYKSWKAIEEAVADYEKATNTHYRVCSSGSVREYNEYQAIRSLTSTRLKTGNTNVLFDLYTCVGRKFTPQQTKNLLKRIGNNKSSQDRLKMLLDALAQVEGNEVMLMQDQFDVTCGIVIQTSAKNCALSTGADPGHGLDTLNEQSGFSLR